VFVGQKVRKLFVEHPVQLHIKQHVPEQVSCRTCHVGQFRPWATWLVIHLLKGAAFHELTTFAGSGIGSVNGDMIYN
jgi:hypothetical protein